ncbi:MAG: hypothetical protein ACTSRS_01975 [Candidatus Helarchaeota archaeon]
MIGVLLCKFDEERGYIPVKVYPSKLRKRKYEEIYKEIARNAIGFGTQVEYQAFTLSEANGLPEVHCLAKRFSISVTEARGGSTLYALVLFSADSDQFDKSILGEAANHLMEKWEKRAEIIRELYHLANPVTEEFVQSEVKVTKIATESNSISRPLLPKELFTETVGFFADGVTRTRVLMMVLALLAMFWILFSNYNLFSFGFMFILGTFFYVVIAKKDTPLKIVNWFLFFFFLLLFLRLTFELMGNPSYLNFLGNFPDFTHPDLALLAFFSGILVNIGLDRGSNVDKGSFITGIIGVSVLILYFFTPLFELLWTLIGGI